MSKQVDVTFDNYAITEILTINSLNRGIGPSQSLRTKNRNDKKGVQFLGTSSAILTHKMDFTLINGVIDKRREISKILNVNEPKKLTYSDEPDKFYWAIPSGDIEFNDQRFYGSGTITWQIFDGVAYSVEPLEFSNSANPNAIGIYNPGTETIPLDLTATFHSDCGYLGLQSTDEKTKVLFGAIGEVDGETFETSELLFDDHLFEDKGWVLNQGTTPPVTYERLQEGTIAYKVDNFNDLIDPNEGFAYVTNYGTGDSWHGASITKTVPADKNGAYAKNWKTNFRFDFNNGSQANPGAGGNRGHNSLTFIDQNDNIIASVVIEDNNPALEKSDIALYVGNKRVYQDMQTDKYYTTQRPSGGVFTVEKLGGRIRFSCFLGNIDMEFSCDANTELRKITWYGAAYQNYPPMINNLLRAIQVIKHNVENWKDIPNKFSANDVLEYKQEGRHISCMVNDTPFLKFRDPGSTIVSCPPGQSTLFIAYSDYAEAPTIKLEGRAAYV